jgi:hypothetical protein
LVQVARVRQQNLQVPLLHQVQILFLAPLLLRVVVAVVVCLQHHHLYLEMALQVALVEVLALMEKLPLHIRVVLEHQGREILVAILF